MQGVSVLHSIQKHFWNPGYTVSPVSEQSSTSHVPLLTCSFQASRDQPERLVAVSSHLRSSERKTPKRLELHVQVWNYQNQHLINNSTDDLASYLWPQRYHSSGWSHPLHWSSHIWMSCGTKEAVKLNRAI